MKRRTFLSQTILTALAVSATGFIRFDGQRYVGDCETTSDVLGPFYRPDSPVRESLRIKGEKGDPIELIGKRLHDDCMTPYKKAKIELWHCDGDGNYDNETAWPDGSGGTVSPSGSFKTTLAASGMPPTSVPMVGMPRAAASATASRSRRR